MATHQKPQAPAESSRPVEPKPAQAGRPAAEPAPQPVFTDWASI